MNLSIASRRTNNDGVHSCVTQAAIACSSYMAAAAESKPYCIVHAPLTDTDERSSSTTSLGKKLEYFKRPVSIQCRRRRHCRRNCEESVDDVMFSNDDNSADEKRKKIRMYFHKRSLSRRVESARSVSCIYKRLWSLIYDSTAYGVCTFDYGQHTRSNASTFPWSSTDALNRINHTSDSVRYIRRVDPTHRCFIDDPYDPSSMHAQVHWKCDIVRDVNSNLTLKLLDYRTNDARNVWNIISTVVSWSNNIYDHLSLFPVRLSIWDLLIINDEPSCVLTDVGDISTFVYTLRVFILILYLSCCYGDFDRTVTNNDRVSNKRHRCAFPTQTAGAYRALFYTSVLPHQLLCGNKSYDDDASSSSSQSSSVQLCILWLREFEGLMVRQLERFALDPVTFRCLEEYDESR